MDWMDARDDCCGSADGGIVGVADEAGSHVASEESCHWTATRSHRRRQRSAGASVGRISVPPLCARMCPVWLCIRGTPEKRNSG